MLFVSIVFVLLIGCGGKGGKNGGVDAPASPSLPLATSAIDAQGGTTKINDPNSNYDGTSVNVPAGAVVQQTTITINAAQPLPVGTLPVEFGPNGTIFAKPVAITLPYSATLLQELGKSDDVKDLMVVSQDTNDNIEVHTAQQMGTRFVNTTTMHFTIFEVLFPRQYKLFRQPHRLIDETPESFEVGITHLKGSLPLVTTEYHPVLARGPSNQTVVLGKGTLTNFFASGQGNVLLIHGFLSSPTTFYFDDQVQSNDNDLLLSLRNATAFRGLFRNIALYQYPSRKHIADNAEQLIELIRKNAKPGFKMTIIAHSMGGLVARYAIETLDLSQYVDKLIMLGTPNEGGQISYFVDYYADSGFLSTPSLVIRLPGLHDLLPGNSFFKPLVGKGINERFPDHKLSTTEYYIIAGKQDPATGDDKLVTVGSATSTYLQVPLNHQTVFDNVEHSELHTKARTNGVLMKIREWVTGKPNSAPTANAGADRVITLGPQATLDGSQSADPDKDAITYAWTQTGGPTVTLSNATTTTATFTPTQTGTYIFQLTVNDTDKTGTDTVTITVNPLPPVVPGQQTFVPTYDTHQSTDTQYNNSNPSRAIYNRLPAGDTASGVAFWAEITFGSVPTTIPRNATIITATLTLEAITSVTSFGTVFALRSASSPIQNFSAAPPITINVTAYVQSQVQQSGSCFLRIDGASLFDYGEFYASEDAQKRGPHLTVEWR